MSRPARDEDRLLRRARLGPVLRVRVLLEVVATYPRVRLLLARHDIRTVVSRLRAGAADRHPPAQALRIGRRLGSPVRRTLDPLPWDSRCLTRSLVLVRMLARRGIVGTLVIGVRPGEAFEAHAWVEHDGRPLLPTLGYDRLTVV